MKKILLVLLLLVNIPLVAAPEAEELKLTLNSDIKSVITSGNSGLSIAGNSSAYIRATAEELAQGRVRVGAFNVLYTDVPQEKVTGLKSEQETGALGFRIENGGAQYLRYDQEKQSITGELKGRVSLSQFEQLIDEQSKERDSHDIDGVSQQATLVVNIDLDQPLKAGQSTQEVITFKGKIAAKITVDQDAKHRLQAYVIELIPQLVIVDYSWVWFFEVAKKLCIQPVRIGTITFNSSSWWPSFNVSYSGDGLNFGMPGANTEWSKADVVFDVRSWKTVWNSSYSTLTDAEEPALRAEVNDDDCVEVYFVDRFSPSSRDGGGNTISGGLEGTKIISSDENADFGIDLTHLAHELGHAMTLKHPGQGFPTAGLPYRIDGSIGTLMCPSGFQNDNPARNSQWNKDSIQNPLFTFTIKPITIGPDCTDDGDCPVC